MCLLWHFPLRFLRRLLLAPPPFGHPSLDFHNPSNLRKPPTRNEYNEVDARLALITIRMDTIPVSQFTLSPEDCGRYECSLSLHKTDLRCKESHYDSTALLLFKPEGGFKLSETNMNYTHLSRLAACLTLEFC